MFGKLGKPLVHFSNLTTTVFIHRYDHERRTKALLVVTLNRFHLCFVRKFVWALEPVFGGSVMFSGVSYYKRWAVLARLLYSARSFCLLFNNYANGRLSNTHARVRRTKNENLIFFFKIIFVATCAPIWFY